MLKHIKGNLIDLAEQGEFDIIVHGCNCQNTMGSGIAKEIRERYPEAYEADTLYDAQVGTARRYMKLGNYSATDVFASAGKFKILNCYTQYDFVPRGKDHFEYASFEVILQKICHFYGNKRVGMPYIGMGLAGGDKDRIIAMLENFAEKVSVKGGSVDLVEFG